MGSSAPMPTQMFDDLTPAASSYQVGAKRLLSMKTTGSMSAERAAKQSPQD
jgi:hypothetical protein